MNLRSALIAGLTCSSIVVASLTPAAALPFTYSPIGQGASELPIVQAQARRGVRAAPAPRRRGGGGNAAGAAVAAGVLGIIAGGIIASQSRPEPQYYPAPGYYPQQGYPVYEQPEVSYAPQPGSRAWYDYCSRRYRSFDARSGTYRGYDGQRYPCE